MNSGEAFVHTERSQAERAFEQITGNSPGLESLLETVERVAPTDSTALIQGSWNQEQKEPHLLTTKGVDL